MKRNKKKSKQKSATPTASPTPAGPSRRGVSRRELFRRVRDYGVIAAVVGAGGWWFVDDVLAHRFEHDLSRIGNGVPAVVQIHDPDCPQCRELQREARAALEGFDPSALQYIVANIATSEGRRFAAEHGVGHVTLLLFDGDGDRREVLVGQNTRAHLRDRFRDHRDADAGS